MRVSVTMKRTDLLTQEEEIWPGIPAILRGDELLYRETDTGASVKVSFTDDAVILERKADIESRTVLYKSGEGKCTVVSPYGNMEMCASLKACSKMFDKWTVTYTITISEDAASEIRIEWLFRYMDKKY